MPSPKTKKTVKTRKTAKSKKTAPAKPEKSASAKPKKNAAAKPESIQPKLKQAADIPDSETVLYPGTALPATEKLETESTLDQGTTSQLVEKYKQSSKKRQGTTFVVPQTQQKNGRALAPEPAAAPEFTPQPGAPADGSSSVVWKPRPPAKLERLQKILAAAGVASRRGAEAMIEQGRVEVNGKVVTVMGTKADAARDHIRVDGKLLQGPERHRYFVLNKPRGFVTTVKDPEGRPTVMQFFSKFSERLYPVGRLDYLSEGLLVVTNDGDLANRLTKASSGVEKTYLVKVSGQPTEAELNILRAGVAIERGRPGSPPVRTSPARIRQVRQGDNPWYEVVLIEGRNRELRKIFEEIGHFVEKIRRIGYGPLVLDQEPGGLRELQPEELAALRRAADGTLRTPKAKDLRRRNLLDAGLLPTVLPKPTSRSSAARPPERFARTGIRLNRPAWKKDNRPTRPPARFAAASTSESRPGDFRPKKFAADRPSEFRPKKFGKEQSSKFRPNKFRADRDRASRTDRTSRPADSFASGAANKFFRPARPSGEGRQFSDKPAWTKPERPARPGAQNFHPPVGRSFDRPPARPASRPAWKKDNRPNRPPARFAAGSTAENRPVTDRPGGYRAKKFSPGRPFRNEGGPSRPFSGPRTERKAGPGWKPKSGAPTDRSSSVRWKSGGKKRG
jgi:23S rRNA pseudouridine2605 synthase